MNILKQISLLLMSLALFACAAKTVDSMASQQIDLSQIQKQWQLVNIDGQAVNAGINSTLNVDTRARATGKLACNNFFGTLVLKDNTLKIDPMGSTRMFCSEPINAVEMAVAGVLNDWSEIKLTGSELTLSGKIHSLTYRAE